MRYLFPLPTYRYLTYLRPWGLVGRKQTETERKTERNRQRQTGTKRNKTETEKPIPNYQSTVEEIHSRARGHDRMYILPPTLFTHFLFSSRFRIFFLVMFEKKMRNNPKYMYLVRRVKVRVEHKKCHISEMKEKKKESDIGRSGSGKICAILHVHYMHGGQRAFPKKRKTKVVSQSKSKKKDRCPFFAATLDRYSAWTVRSVVLWDIII